MLKPTAWASALVFVSLLAAAPAISDSQSTPGVEVVRHDADHRVDVLVGGKPFTSYLYPPTLKKPVLFPILTASGTPVTRGFPLDPRPGDSTDHPHHVGSWFNFGDVNGFDFWGYSDATPEKDLPHMGRIVHSGITRASGGADSGELAVTADWITNAGTTLLREETRFTFRGGQGDERTIDRETRWTALDRPVTFGDTKEGAFGIRVARELEHPSKETRTFTNDSGEVETVEKSDRSPANGEYLASDGTRGEAVWGTRGPWMALRGTVGKEPVTLAIFDHPTNHGYPTYWHARGYGLFAANPFGRKGFDPTLEATSFRLEPGKSVVFHHRILVKSKNLSREELQGLYEGFVREE
jgi:hypothetical protein